MPEVDYSEFYYRRDPPEDRDGARRDTERCDKKPKRKLSGVISAVLIVILLSGIVFFAADFFMKGRLISEVKGALRGNDYEYYLVVCDCDGRDKAYAQSLLVKQGGGSGYIVSGEKYLVVYSPFTDRAEAEAVVKKNDGTYVYIVDFSSKDVDFYNSFHTEIELLIDALADFEKGRLTDSDAYAAFKASKERLALLQKDDLSSEKAAVVEYAIGSIDGLDFAKGAKISFLSDARYVLSGVIVSLQKTA